MKTKEYDISFSIPPLEPPKVYFYSKVFNETKLYTSLKEIGEDFGIDNPLLYYAYNVFIHSHNIGVTFTNEIEDIEKYSIVSIDSTIEVYEIRKLYEANMYLTLDETFKQLKYRFLHELSGELYATKSE